MKTSPAIAVAALVCLPQIAQAGWSIEIVEDVGDVGTYPSLAFDLGGNPCISFRDETADQLKLACRQGSAWPVEIVDGDLYVGYYSALVIDGGVEHIAYRQGSDVYSELRHADRIGGTWAVETVDHVAQGVGHRISMAVDANGNPHISHTKNWGQWAVRYSHWTGSSWESETVVREGAEGTALVLQGDRPLIAFAGSYLGLAELKGRKWRVSTIDPEAAESVAMAIEESLNGDILHAVYSSYTEDLNELRHKSWTEATGWEEPLTIDMPLEYTPDISLAIHGSELHVSYFDQANGALKYARKVAGGSWTTEFVDTSGDVGLYSSIAVDPDGNPHIAYYDGANGDLRYAVFADSCTADADCDDQNVCTEDRCTEGACQNIAIEGGCSLGGAPGMCCDGTCVLPVCELNSDCFAMDADTCIDIGFCSNACDVTCWAGDGYCPPGCEVPLDTDCPDCSTYTNRKSCNADSGCRWDNQSKECLPV